MTQLSVIQTGGKQYLVTSGQKLKVEKLPGEVGSKIAFDKVLFTTSGAANFQVGKPTLSAPVAATILKQGRSRKVVVFKFKAKSKYRRKAGHRQEFTEVEIV